LAFLKRSFNSVTSLEVYEKVIVVALLFFVVAAVAIWYVSSYGTAESLGQSSVELVNAGIAAFFGVLAIEVVSRVFISYGRMKSVVHSVSSAVGFFKLFAYLALLLILLDIFKVNLTGLLIGAGFFGIVIGLAAQTTLGNVFAGLSLLVSRPFKPGERITLSTWQYGAIPPTYPHDYIIPGFSGVVTKLSLVYTEILNDDGTLVAVPNSIVNQAIVINYARSTKMQIKVWLELDIKYDFAAFEKVLMGIIKKDRRLEDFTLTHVRIANIGLVSYGINIMGFITEIPEEHYVRRAVNEDALAAVRKLKKI
jgi:small-conductance mechanosensitive channel